MSILLYTCDHRFRHMETLGAILYVANLVLFTAFSVLTVLRYTLYPYAAELVRGQAIIAGP